MGSMTSHLNTFTPGKLYMLIIHASVTPINIVIAATEITIIKEFFT